MEDTDNGNPAKPSTSTPAAERAKAAGCRILGTGIRAGDGVRMIVVSSWRDAAAVWVVAVKHGHLTCGCTGGRYNHRLYMHRALTHAFLVAEANPARQQAQSAQQAVPQAAQPVRSAYRRDQARGYNDTR